MEGSQSCGAAELQKGRGGGGLWVAEVQRCRVAEWLSCRMADCGIAELQSKRDGGLQSWGVAELQSFRVAEIQSYIFGNWHSCKVAGLESCRGTEFRAIEWLSCRGA